MANDLGRCSIRTGGDVSPPPGVCASPGGFESQGLTTLIKGGYAEDDPVTPETITELVDKYRKTEEELQS